MNSRRSFVKTLLYTSGSLYVGSSLFGCKKVEKAEFGQHISGSDIRAMEQISLVRQRVRRAHTYLRDRESFPEPTVVKEIDCVIIGSGYAGITAAHILRNEKKSFVLIENEDRPGGAAVNYTWNDIEIPLGSSYFVDYSDTLKSMSKEVGISPITINGDALFYNGDYYNDFWKEDTMKVLASSPKELAILQKFKKDVLAMDVPTYPVSPTLNKQHHEYDLQSVESLINNKYPSALLREYLNLYTLSSMGGEVSKVNLYSFFNFYQSEMGEENGYPRYSFLGGTHTLPKMYSQLIGDSFQPNTMAVRIEQIGKKVHITCINNDDKPIKYIANSCILSTQKFLAQHLIPDLPAIYRDTFSKIEYAPYTTIHLCANEPLTNQNAFDTWVLPKSKHFVDIVNPTQLNKKKTNTVVSLFNPIPQDLRHNLLSDEFALQITENAVDYACSLLKIKKDILQQVVFFGWGHMLVVPTVGSHSLLTQLSNKPLGSIFFAHTDNDCAPAIENAVAHGEYTANMVLKHLKTS